MATWATYIVTPLRRNPACPLSWLTHPILDDGPKRIRIHFRGNSHSGGARLGFPSRSVLGKFGGPQAAQIAGDCSSAIRAHVNLYTGRRSTVRLILRVRAIP